MLVFELSQDGEQAGESLDEVSVRPFVDGGRASCPSCASCGAAAGQQSLVGGAAVDVTIELGGLKDNLFRFSLSIRFYSIKTLPLEKVNFELS